MEFTFIESQTTFECTSKDEVWRLSGKKASDDNDKLFITCMPLLLTPSGYGNTVNKCFESFINNCDEYINQVNKYKEEAQKYLREQEEDKSVDDLLSTAHHDA